MTNGTSQGLFIVVAIVIFGIFVGLSYTVFGSNGGLTDGLQNLFYKATEQVVYDIAPKTEINLIAYSDVTSYVIPNTDTYLNNGKSIVLGTANIGAGVRMPYTLVEENKNYKLTFKVRKLSGTLNAMGGHLWYADDTKVFIDGELVSKWKEVGIDPKSTNNWSVGVRYPQDSEEHLIEVFFDTNNYADYVSKEIVANPSGAINADFYIQPNRSEHGPYYKIEITELGLFEV